MQHLVGPVILAVRRRMPRRGAVAEHSHGPVVGFVDDLLQFACHGGGDGRAFGQVAADDAVAVLVAAAPPRAVRVGEIRGHARFVAQLGVPGELGAVVMRHSGAGGGRQPGEHGLLRRHARGGGLVGHDRGCVLSN